MGDGRRVSPEMIAILAVGAALAGVILSGQARTDSRFVALEARMGSLEQRMSALEQRQARIERLVEGAALFGARNDSQGSDR